jgi:hypothetical protein
MIPKIDIEKGKPQRLPSPPGRGLRGGDKNGDNAPSPQPSPVKGEGEVERVNVFFWDDKRRENNGRKRKSDIENNGVLKSSLP